MIIGNSYRSLDEGAIQIKTSTTKYSKYPKSKPIVRVNKSFYDACGILEKTILVTEGAEERGDTINVNYEILSTDNRLLKIATITDSNPLNSTQTTYDERGNWIRSVHYKNGEIHREVIRELEYK